jgi:hypothetical protein
MNKQRASLVALDPELQTAIVRERDHDRVTGPQLAALDVQKQADNAKTKSVVAQIHELEARINSDLTAGLITKGDAETQLAALNQAEDAYTDSKIADVLLSDNVLDKTTVGTKALDVLEKQAELRSEIAQLDITSRLTACTTPSPSPSRAPTTSTPTAISGSTSRLSHMTIRLTPRSALLSTTAISTWCSAARSAR